MNPNDATSNPPDSGLPHLPQQEKGAMSQGEAPGPDALELKAARDVLLSLSKALKASRVYHPDNPAYQKLFQDLANSLASFLTAQPVMTWNIGQFRIDYEGQTVYENRDPGESLAFHLHKDGLRRLRFFEGVEPSEIQTFLEVLKSSIYEPDADDDLATLFWEKDFPNIDYMVVDVMAEEGKEIDFSSLSQGLLDHGKTELEAPLDTQSPGAQAGAADSLPTYTDLISPAPAGRIPIFSLAEEEVERVKSEMGTEKGRDLGEEFIALLLEILSAKEDIEGSKEILAIVERIAESYCLQGNFLKAYQILRDLRQLMDLPLNLPEERRGQIREAVKRMGSSERLRRLPKVLNRADEGGLRSFQSYVSLLDHQAILPLCEVLGELEQMKARRILCDSIAQLAQGHVELLGPAVKDSRWFVARNVAYILGLMRDPQGVRYLKELVKDGESRVWKEAIRALGAIGDLASRDHLLGCLQSSPVPLQVAAARALASLGEKRALSPLLKMVEDRDFLNRSQEEKREILEAVGQLGSDQVLPLLREILFKKSMFHRGRIEEMREGAAIAMALIGTPAAKGMLREGARGADKAISQVCRAALSRVSRLSAQSTWEDSA